MGRRGPKPSTLLCPQGRPIGAPRATEQFDWVRAGPCDAHGGPTLHGALSNCTCSLLRGRRRLCRDCAIAYDYLTTGSSRLDRSWDPRLVAEVRELLDRGHDAARTVLQ
jgi:hypothetical protein